MNTRTSIGSALLVAINVLALGACEAGTVVTPGDASRDSLDRRDAAITADARDTSTSLPDTHSTDTSSGIDAFDSGPRDTGTDVPPAVDVPPPPPDSGVMCPGASPRDCSRGTGTGEADQCFDGNSCYIGNVQNAVRRVIAANGSWFDMTSMPGCAVILQVDNFMDAVVADLTSSGLCAIRDPNAPGEEVTVKHDNGFSENFDIVASTGCARYGPLIYTGYCTPAWW